MTFGMKVLFFIESCAYFVNAAICGFFAAVAILLVLTGSW